MIPSISPRLFFSSVIIISSCGLLKAVYCPYSIVQLIDDPDNPKGGLMCGPLQVTSVRFAPGKGNILLTNSRDSTLKVSDNNSTIEGKTGRIMLNGPLKGLNDLPDD